jgi:hypothetical protein
LQLADTLKPDAMLLVDAVPGSSDVKAATAVHKKNLASRAVWAIHTDYPQGDRHRPLQDFNETLIPQTHADLSNRPAKNAQVRTLEPPAPNVKTSPDRHIAVAATVFQARAPYQWLLDH